MAAPIALRDDYDGAALRRLARSSDDANQTRRLLALAVICDGGLRGVLFFGLKRNGFPGLFRSPYAGGSHIGPIFFPGSMRGGRFSCGRFQARTLRMSFQFFAPSGRRRWTFGSEFWRRRAASSPIVSASHAQRMRCGFRHLIQSGSLTVTPLVEAMRVPGLRHWAMLRAWMDRASMAPSVRMTFLITSGSVASQKLPRASARHQVVCVSGGSLDA